MAALTDKIHPTMTSLVVGLCVDSTDESGPLEHNPVRRFIRRVHCEGGPVTDCPAGRERRLDAVDARVGAGAARWCYTSGNTVVCWNQHSPHSCVTGREAGTGDLVTGCVLHQFQRVVRATR